MAQKTGIPKWVARSVSGNMGTKICGCPSDRLILIATPISFFWFVEWKMTLRTGSLGSMGGVLLSLLSYVRQCGPTCESLIRIRTLGTG